LFLVDVASKIDRILQQASIKTETVMTESEIVCLVVYVIALQRFFGLKVKQSHYRRIRPPDFKNVGTWR